MKNLKKPLHFETAISRPERKKITKKMKFYFTNLCNRVIINHFQNFVGDCVCHIVLLIPAAFKFIMREIPANIYSR